MNSRVHPKYKTRCRVGNWTEYDRALVQRGDITLWISPDAIDAWEPAPSGRRGGQRRFSDPAIETALTLRLVFKLPLRQAEGFLRSVLSLMRIDLEAPDHTTLSRRGQHLNIERASRRTQPTTRSQSTMRQERVARRSSFRRSSQRRERENEDRDLMRVIARSGER
jgi:hypothetical protein